MEVIREANGIASEIIAAASSMSAVYSTDFSSKEDEEGERSAYTPQAANKAAAKAAESSKSFKSKEKRKRDLGQQSRES